MSLIIIIIMSVQCGTSVYIVYSVHPCVYRIENKKYTVTDFMPNTNRL